MSDRRKILEHSLSYLRKGLRNLSKDTTIPHHERVQWIHAVQPIIKMWKSELAQLV